MTTVSPFNNTVTFKNDNDSYKYFIRQLVYQFWFEYKIPTLKKVLHVVNKHSSLPDFSRKTLSQLLKEIHFEYSEPDRNSALIEKNELTLRRQNYLNAVKMARDEGRPIYYLGETFMTLEDVSRGEQMNNTVGSSQSEFSRDSFTKYIDPNEKRIGLIALHIGSEDSFVPGGLLCLHLNINGNDFSDSSSVFFFDWLKRVLPRLKDNAIIVMKDAFCHSIKNEQMPTVDWESIDIKNWLKSKGVVINQPMIKAELMEIVKSLISKYDTSVVKEIIRKDNKDVLLLPLHHIELNPVERVWSIVKTHFKSDINIIKPYEFLNYFNEAVGKVDAAMWGKCIEQTKDEEDKMWCMNFIIDELMEEEQKLARSTDVTDELMEEEQELASPTDVTDGFSSDSGSE